MREDNSMLLKIAYENIVSPTNDMEAKKKKNKSKLVRS